MREEFDRIISSLEEKGIWFEVKEHEPVFTSQQASEVRGVPLRWGVKAMVLKAPKSFFLVLVRADKKVDFRLFKKKEGISKLRLANPEEVLELTNCEIGSVPPFGFAKGMKTYLDKELLGQGKVTFNAGLHEFSVVMRGKDLKKVLKAEVF